jgi:hypothetical protein
LPIEQSLSAAHVVLHSLAPQMYAPQFTVIVSAHRPEPVHVAASVATPFVQLAGRHDVADPGKPVHAMRSVPSHRAAAQTSPASPPGHAARLCGAPLTGTHVPSPFGTSHASHCPSHGALQQKPSTQRLLVHHSRAVHVFPLSRLLSQRLPLQNASAAQSAFVVQVVLHAPPVHL